MKQVTVHVLHNTRIAPDFCELTFVWKRTWGIPAPGSFVTIRVSPAAIPLLRRPFAFSGCDPENETASIILQKRGPATQILDGLHAGDHLDLIGPLGKGFSRSPNIQTVICIAGGAGLGPLLFWAETCRKQGCDTHLVFGCRNKSQVPSNPSFSHVAPDICTDDGSRGFHGTTIDFCRSVLSPRIVTPAATGLYACGPAAMLKAAHQWALETGVRLEVSLEQTMACGVGACMGCAVKRADNSYARVCHEGPVFDSRELAWT